MPTVVQIALGGALGAVARHYVGRAALHQFGTGFPWGVLIVNVVGSFAMGILIVWLAERGLTRYAPLMTVGFLGGFTTFSSFSLDTMLLYERGELGLAALYVVVSVAASIGALALALVFARSILT